MGVAGEAQTLFDDRDYEFQLFVDPGPVDHEFSAEVFVLVRLSPAVGCQFFASGLGEADMKAGVRYSMDVHGFESLARSERCFRRTLLWHIDEKDCPSGSRRHLAVPLDGGVEFEHSGNELTPQLSGEASPKNGYR